jgi:hypothetical protein
MPYKQDKLTIKNSTKNEKNFLFHWMDKTGFEHDHYFRYEINRDMFMQKKANDSDFDCGAFYDKINGKWENIREIQ